MSSALDCPASSSGRYRPFVAALLLAVGCSGTGVSCGSSGGAFSTTDAVTNKPIKFTGDRHDNFAQVRLTNELFTSFLNADSLNQVVGNLNSATGTAFTIGCIDPGIAKATVPLSWDWIPASVLTIPIVGDLIKAALNLVPSSVEIAPANFCLCGAGCSPSSSPNGFLTDITKFHVLVGDTNFSGACDAGDSTPVKMHFNQVNWKLDPSKNVLTTNISMAINTTLYFRTVEAHNHEKIFGVDALDVSLCDGATPVQGAIHFNSNLASQKGTTINLDLAFDKAPDGRLIVRPTSESLAALATSPLFAALDIDDFVDPTLLPPATGQYKDDGCGVTPATNYTTYTGEGANRRLACGAVFNWASGTCNLNAGAMGSTWCTVFGYVRPFLLNYLQRLLADRITAILQAQLDKMLCAQGVDSSSNYGACDATHACPLDDNGAPTVCQPARGVCLAAGQSQSPTSTTCEPNPIAIQGTLDFNKLASTVTFPADARLNLLAGLGGKTSAPTVSTSTAPGAGPNTLGLQLSVYGGTQSGNPVQFPNKGVSFCIANTSTAPLPANAPALDFDDPANWPDNMKGVNGTSTYQVGLSLAGAALTSFVNDGYNAGLFCLGVDQHTSDLLNTNTLAAFLPSIGLLTGNKGGAPVAIRLRPTQVPTVTVGRGSVVTAGTTPTLAEPLLTLQMSRLDLDIYVPIDDRWVRLLTLEADVNLPLGLRTSPNGRADQLQPVLGALSSTVTNMTFKNSLLLAEDPTNLVALFNTALTLAQGPIASLLSPVTLPTVLGLDLQVVGVGGAMQATGAGGYHHLAIWSKVQQCGGAGQPACPAFKTARVSAKLAEARISRSALAVFGKEQARPGVIVQAGASTETGVAEYSYRVDGGLWSPWVATSQFEVASPLFLLQGHHVIEVTARDAGDDRSQDPEPVALGLDVSFEP